MGGMYRYTSIVSLMVTKNSTTQYYFTIYILHQSLEGERGALQNARRRSDQRDLTSMRKSGVPQVTL